MSRFVDDIVVYIHLRDSALAPVALSTHAALMTTSLHMYVFVTVCSRRALRTSHFVNDIVTYVRLHDGALAPVALSTHAALLTTSLLTYVFVRVICQR